MQGEDDAAGARGTAQQGRQARRPEQLEHAADGGVAEPWHQAAAVSGSAALVAAAASKPSAPASSMAASTRALGVPGWRSSATRARAPANTGRLELRPMR